MVSNKQLIAALQTTHGKAIVEWLTDEYLLADNNVTGQGAEKYILAAGQREVVHTLIYKSKSRSE